MTRTAPQPQSHRPADAPIIELRGVSFGYGDTPVLEDVDLRLPRGDFASIVGPNGSGKTTLLRLILGVARPDHGAVRVLGTTPERARPRIGYMPQYVSVDADFPMSVRDVVLMGRLNRFWPIGRFGRKDRQAANRALGEVELADLRNRPFSALSGGQRQRVLIARALASDPELLLLDEPTANLDVHMEEELYALLQRLSDKLTIVMVSHDLGFVSQFVRTVVCVKRTVVAHPTSEITGEIIKEIYGDVRMVRHDHHGEHKGEPGCMSS